MPETTIEQALQKLSLIEHTPLKNRQNLFNRPFNTIFMPAEYASINCCFSCSLTSCRATALSGDSDTSDCCPPCDPSPAVPSPPPTPTNFHQTGATDEGGGITAILSITYQWDSSTGQLNDLGACQVRERVNYPTSSNAACPSPNTGQMCYWPASPPFPPTTQSGSEYINPTIIPGPATAGGLTDTNSIKNLNFIKPYSNFSFDGTQMFEYSCNNGAWVQFGGPFKITRKVAQNSSSQWVFTISKTNVSFSSTYLLP